jgi:Fur family zinc uptake transcriptional regulator
MRHKRRTGALLSANEELIFSALQKASKPLGAYDLLGLLRDQGIASPTSVYRALKHLTELGVVHRIATLNAFALCQQGRAHGLALFAICDECGAVAESDARAAVRPVSECASGIGFSILHTMLEIRGLCQSCEGHIPRPVHKNESFNPV